MATTQTAAATKTTKRQADRLMRELDNLAIRPVFSAEAIAVRDMLMADIRATLARFTK